MRHTKLLLGAVTLTLGIAGAFATMASNVRNIKAKVFTTLKVGCITVTTPCIAGSDLTCRTATGVPAQTVFTIASACNVKFIRQR
ncbi:DUF6520 family protein [Chitinophaga sp. 212800010-3]|uniref:DUF6520 family protein n=1 Tax=unclassified Chitinophaga TaxID=2619133 RepID=UPI002DF6CB60|nr:hypothetical protein [Chitinophaga sp. 212800010-3]